MKWSDPAQPPDTDIQTVNQDIGGGRDNFDMVLVTTLDNAHSSGALPASPGPQGGLGLCGSGSFRPGQCGFCI